jgi:hypothetical protein
MSSTCNREEVLAWSSCTVPRLHGTWGLTKAVQDARQHPALQDGSATLTLYGGSRTVRFRRSYLQTSQEHSAYESEGTSPVFQNPACNTLAFVTIPRESYVLKI